MGGASKSPGRSSTNKGSAKGSGKGGGGSIAYPRKAAAIPKWTVTAYTPPRKISDKELEAARKVIDANRGENPSARSPSVANTSRSAAPRANLRTSVLNTLSVFT